MNAPERLSRAPHPGEVRASPRRPRRRPSLHPRQRRNSRSWASVLETGLKLTVDVTVSLGAIAALSQLLPSYTRSQDQLEQLHEDVDTTRSQVQGLQGQFSRYFDPTQVRNLIEEETQRLDPQRRPIVWTEPVEQEANR